MSFESAASASRPPLYPLRQVSYKKPRSDPPALYYSASEDDESDSGDDSDVEKAAPAAAVEAEEDEEVEMAARVKVEPPPIRNPFAHDVIDYDRNITTSNYRIFKGGDEKWINRKTMFAGDSEARPYFCRGDRFTWGPFGEWIVQSKIVPVLGDSEAPKARHLVTASCLHEWPTDVYNTFYGDENGELHHVGVTAAYRMFSTNEVIDKYKQAKILDPVNIVRGTPGTCDAVIPFSLYYHTTKLKMEARDRDIEKKVKGPAEKKRKAPPAAAAAAAASDGEPPAKKPRGKAPPPGVELMSKMFKLYLYDRLVPAARKWAIEKGRTPRDYIEEKFIKSAISLDKWTRDHNLLPATAKATAQSRANVKQIAERAGKEMEKRIKRYEGDHTKVSEHWMMEIYVSTNPDAWSTLQKVLTGLDEEKPVAAK